MLVKKKDDVDLLIIVPPARNKNTMWPPYGAMYVVSALRQEGYNPQILNVDAEGIPNSEAVKRIKEIEPKYIGFTGMVATSYKYIKEISLELKQKFPDKIQILGGGLSNAVGPIFKNTAIDIVVHGEGESTACDLIKCLKTGGDLDRVRGIYYRKDPSYIYTGLRPLLRDLDMLPYPAFDSVDMEHYILDGVQFIRNFTNEVINSKIFDKKRNRKMINILTNRGCVGSCNFCVRTDLGLRMHSIKYVFDFIEYCIDRFGVGFVSFGDECFAANKARNWQFIEEYKKRKIDIIFRILGMRVDTVDIDILRAFKEIGCYMINYGYESGSQKMLNIMNKRVTIRENQNAILWTHEAGIFTPIQLILGMPGETNQTIQETIDSLKSLNLDYNHYKCTYALPIPGSPLYDYARLTGAIEDEDIYLTSLGEIEGTPIFHVNITEEKDEIVGTWREKIKMEMNDYYIYTKYKTQNRIIKKCIFFLESIELHIRTRDIFATVKRRLRLFLSTMLNIKQKKIAIEQKNAQFRKKKDINIEEIIKNSHYPLSERGIPLKKINEEILRSEIFKAINH